MYMYLNMNLYLYMNLNMNMYMYLYMYMIMYLYMSALARRSPPKPRLKKIYRTFKKTLDNLNNMKYSHIRKHVRTFIFCDVK